jgi:hypothetical protein
VAVDLSGNAIVTTDPASATPTWSAPAAIDAGNGLLAISCPSNDLCVAVDNAGQVVTSTDPSGGAGTWTPALVDTGHILKAVSCPSVSFCVAVNNHGDAVSSNDPAGASPTWTLHTGIDSTNTLDAVSCTSASLCVATDQAGNIAHTTTPAEDTAWQTVHVEDPIYDELEGVSCPSPSLCVAVDDSGGDSLESTNPTGGAADWARHGRDGRWSFIAVSCAPVQLPLCVAVDQGGNAVVAHVPPPNPGPGPGNPTPPDTKLLSAKINKKKRKATFRFQAIGTASGFQCSLARKGAGASFSSCQSPKKYKHLKPGRYRFLVRAVNAAGPDPTPASKRFKLKPRKKHHHKHHH